MLVCGTFPPQKEHTRATSNFFVINQYNNVKDRAVCCLPSFKLRVKANQEKTKARTNW